MLAELLLAPTRDRRLYSKITCGCSNKSKAGTQCNTQKPKTVSSRTAIVARHLEEALTSAVDPQEILHNVVVIFHDISFVNFIL